MSFIVLTPSFLPARNSSFYKIQRFDESDLLLLTIVLLLELFNEHFGLLELSAVVADVVVVGRHGGGENVVERRRRRRDVDGRRRGVERRHSVAEKRHGGSFHFKVFQFSENHF